jgi:putative addiction module component (TIGR02574 family)
MSPDLANLLGALRDQPDDEVAYLALADWSLDQPDLPTQARGEHVRLSLELGKLSRKYNAEAPASRRRREGARAATRPLREQVKALERQHRVAWLGPLRDLAHRCDFLPGGLLKVEFAGGRIEQARKAQVKAPTEGEFVWVSNLVARSASLGDLDWLADMLPAGCVRSFVLGAPENAVGLPDVLARCRWLAGVRALDVHSYYPNLADIGAAGLVRLECLASLQELHLSHAEIGLDGCSAIGRSQQLRGLRELHLQRCGLGEDHLRALLAPAFVPPLVALSLERNNLTPAAAEAAGRLAGVGEGEAIDARRQSPRRRRAGGAGAFALPGAGARPVRAVVQPDEPRADRSRPRPTGPAGGALCAGQRPHCRRRAEGGLRVTVAAGATSARAFPIQLATADVGGVAGAIRDVTSGASPPAPVAAAGAARIGWATRRNFMSDAVARIVAMLGGLSQPERAELARAVLLSLESELEGPSAEQPWKAELARWVGRLRSGEAVGVPAEQVFADRRGRS